VQPHRLFKEHSSSSPSSIGTVVDSESQVHLHDNSVMETLTNITPYPDIANYDVIVNDDLLPMLKDLYTVKLLPLYRPRRGVISLVKERNYSIAKLADAAISFTVSYTQAKKDEVAWHLQPVRSVLLNTLKGHSIQHMGKSVQKRKGDHDAVEGSSSKKNAWGVFKGYWRLKKKFRSALFM